MKYEQVVNSTRMAGATKRWHTWPIIGEQRNDSHTWQVIRLYIELWGVPRSEVFYHLVYHDCPEIRTGDMPSYTKQEVPEFRSMMKAAEKRSAVQLKIQEVELTEQEKVRIKIADVLERWEFAYEQLAFGNKFALPVIGIVMKDLNEWVPRLTSQEDQTRVHNLINNPPFTEKKWED